MPFPPRIRSLKRVLYVWQAQYPWDVRVEKICNSLKRNGIEVEILARRGPGEPITGETQPPEQIPIHRVGFQRFRPLSLPVPGNPFWERGIALRVREFKPDLIIARDIPLALPSARAARRAGIPMVIDMAEHYPVAMRTWKKYQSNPGSRFLVNTLKLPDWIERESVKRAQGVLPVCEEQKQRLIRDYGVDPDTIVPILNTTERERFPTLSAQGFERKGSVFGYHGVVIQDRDLLTVVRGFGIAAEKNKDIRLVIAGSGESVDDVKQEAAQSKHRDRVSFLGPFKPHELAQLYSEVDYGVVSWKLNDFTNNTIANKFFDYAAFGKPMLYTRTKPMVNLMQSMRCGVGFDGGDPQSVAQGMLELLDADYPRLARDGREAVEKQFNWEEDARKMIDFLSRLV